ncbi:DUF4097 family beta strand repeat-containing protein [Levilactobacillus huananensis]|uniref:DUF4097 family beta strand repeat-containing protein n=1 Tax=Levilactobacillus huananensis TaxID=2486019 RepID=UPI0013DDDD0F|nr:DUF4097 family beta strand repeat-containing protein [Levilactobacillus huananensis]
MKKLFLIITITILGLVISLLGITASQHRLTVNTGQLERLTHQTIPLEEQPHQLRLAVRTARVTIRTGTTPAVSLNQVAKAQYKVVNTPDHLSITEPLAHQHQLTIGHTPIITITLPAKRLKHLQITQLNGTLHLHPLIVNTGQITHQNGTTIAKHLTIHQGGQFTKCNGATTLTNLSVQGLQVSVKNGQAKLNGRRIAENHHAYRRAGQHPFIIRSGNGQVNLTTN